MNQNGSASSPDWGSASADTPANNEPIIIEANLNKPTQIIPQPVRLSSLRSLELLIASEGNLHLAAELGGTRPELIIAAIVGDENNHDTMARYVRAFTTMKMFSLMGELQEAISEAISEDRLKASDLVRAFSNVVEVLNVLTDSKTSTQNINVFEQVSKSLPPDVREALRVVNDQSQEAAS